MYVSVTTASTGDEPGENATMVGEEMTGWLHGVEGFAGNRFGRHTLTGLGEKPSRDGGE